MAPSYSLAFRRDATRFSRVDSHERPDRSTRATWFVTEIIVDGEDVTRPLTAAADRPHDFRTHHLHGVGTPEPACGAVQLPLVLAIRGIEFAPTVRIEADGRFSVEGVVPGTYRLQRVEGLRSPLERMWLKSVIVNGRDILDAPIELRQSAGGCGRHVVRWGE